ncbi:hypothetical protein [Labrys monachus]|uniref:Uncharacterized protein n=1 Tax=Labrys monachus TaxID=217067 RepID=A0ABU0FHB0_9HYPH|nr:hypothetical protein [Labrys monachus]MDQ0393965.1 hypothetical protein [Labrys monachus]
MLLASSAEVAVGWFWHTAYRARWHWKLKREGALIAAAVVALAGAVDTARTIHRSPQASDIAPLSAPVAAAMTPDTAAVAATITLPAAGAVAANPPAIDGTQTAQAPDAAPKFPIIQDQTGSIDQNDPIETILPMDSSARKDDPIAQKINERFGDAAPAEPAPKKAKPRAVRTASAKPARIARPPRKPADDSSMD